MKKIRIYSPDQYQSAISDNAYCIADFYKDRCPACTMLDLSLSRLAELADVSRCVLLKIKLEIVGESFFHSLAIRQTPTLLFVCDTIERARLSGFQSPLQLKVAMQQLLFTTVEHEMTAV